MMPRKRTLWQIMWGIMLIPPVLTAILFLLLNQPSFYRVPPWVSDQKKCEAIGCDRPATRASEPISPGYQADSREIRFSNTTNFYCEEHGRLRETLVVFPTLGIFILFPWVVLSGIGALAFYRRNGWLTLPAKKSSI